MTNSDQDAGGLPDLSKVASALRPQWLESPANPSNWSLTRKWFVTIVASWITFSAGINATAILTPAATIGEQFGFSDNGFPTSYWTVTTWLMGGALGPMVGMPLLEEFGVRGGYLICYVGFMLFLIPQAVATNFATLLVTRFFAGFFSSILQNGMESVVADMFPDDIERSLPLALFILVYEAGYTLGPAYAACFPAEDWRWIFYTHLIVFGAFLPVVWFVLRETRGHLIRTGLSPDVDLHPQDPEGVVGDEEVEKASTKTEERPQLLALFYEAIVRPVVLLFTQPVIAALTLWSAFTTALVFISTESVEQVYVENFGFNDRTVGAVQVSIFIGEVVGFLACLPQNAYYTRSARWNKEEPGQPVPEARLMLSIPASFIGLAGGLFWYAWSSSPGLSWILPSIGLGLVGFGITVVVTTAVVYMTDAYTSIAGSAVAAIAMGENLLSAWVPLSTPRMYTALGHHWASSLLAFVALALSFIPVVLMVYGRHIRARSNLMEGK